MGRRVEVVKGDAANADDVSTRTARRRRRLLPAALTRRGCTDSKTSSRPWLRRSRTPHGPKVSPALFTSVDCSPPRVELSPHLASRLHVGEILRASGVPTAELRAAVIIGSGSASFEMLRYLTERLPAMVTPRWVRNRIQPIAIRDVLRYLVGAADLPPDVNRSFDIGGPDVLTYEEMMQRYAAVAELRRRLIIVPVPVLSPSLSSHWVGLVTPVPAFDRPTARAVAEARGRVPRERHRRVRPRPARRPHSVRPRRRARASTHQGRRRRDAGGRTPSLLGAPSDPLPSDPDWAGGSLTPTSATRETTASAEALWRVIEGIGGERGWYSFPLAWETRGLWIASSVASDFDAGAATRPTLRRRVLGLLAGRGAAAERDAAPARRDARPWAGVARDEHRAEPADDAIDSARCSIRADCGGTRTGGWLRPSTASCSDRWRATSWARPKPRDARRPSTGSSPTVRRSEHLVCPRSVAGATRGHG